MGSQPEVGSPLFPGVSPCCVGGVGRQASRYRDERQGCPVRGRKRSIGVNGPRSFRTMRSVTDEAGHLLSFLPFFFRTPFLSSPVLCSRFSFPRYRWPAADRARFRLSLPFSFSNFLCFLWFLPLFSSLSFPLFSPLPLNTSTGVRATSSVVISHRHYLRHLHLSLIIRIMGETLAPQPTPQPTPPNIRLVLPTPPLSSFSPTLVLPRSRLDPPKGGEAPLPPPPHSAFERHLAPQSQHGTAEFFAHHPSAKFFHQLALSR